MCFGVNMAQFPEKTERDRVNQQRGEVIVSAISRFHEANGKYLESLSELRARQNAELPTPATGQYDFSYEVDPKGYSLEFLESSFGMFSGDGYHRYRSGSDNWDFYLP